MKMEINDKNISISKIDDGKEFNWGKTSKDYALYRDIYPKEFYQRILDLGLCKDGQICLDIGTGTGVLPRNMYQYGASWIGTDISENQIAEAKELAYEARKNIEFFACDAKNIDFNDNTFDVITACQCIWYLDHSVTAPKFAKMLKENGSFLILYMGWLPYEDEIARKSEELILKYNPKWTGHGDTVHPVWVPDEYLDYFYIEEQKELCVDISFTRESWHGRMRACRGTRASMSPDEFAIWNDAHIKMLEGYSNSFKIKHYVSYAWLKKK